MAEDARTREFVEYVQSGGLVESTDWMPDEYRKRLVKFIEMHANSELMGVLPERDWILRAPTLQRKLALTAKIQDEVGHAQLIYRVVEDLGKPREACLDDLIAGKAKFHNVFHYPTRSWGDVGVIAWLVDKFGQPEKTGEIMMTSLLNILWLGLKEIRSLVSDMVMVLFVIYAFTLAIYIQATGTSSEVNNASIAYADEDGSALSKELFNAFYPPRFQMPEMIPTGEVERAMDNGRFMFVVVIPPMFEEDLRAGRNPDIQLNIDATAMQQAGIGANYIKNIINKRISSFLTRTDISEQQPIKPEPGGMLWHDVLDLLREVCRKKNVIGFDLVELAPIPGIVAPDFLAARLAYRMMGYVAQKSR